LPRARAEGLPEDYIYCRILCNLLPRMLQTGGPREEIKMRQSVVRLYGVALFALSPALFAAKSPVQSSLIVSKPLTPIASHRPVEKVGGNCWAQLDACNAGCCGDYNCLRACDCDYSICANLPVPNDCGGPPGGN